MMFYDVVYDVLISLTVTVQLSQHHLLVSFVVVVVVYSCLLCYRLIDQRCLTLFLGYLFLSICVSFLLQ